MRKAIVAGALCAGIAGSGLLAARVEEARAEEARTESAAPSEGPRITLDYPPGSLLFVEQLDPADDDGALASEGPGPVAHMLQRMDPARLRLIVGGLLAAQETTIGIRPDQMTAWRAYTSAIIAMLPTENTLAPWQAHLSGSKREAFGIAEDIANAIIDRGDAARRLKDAIVALKAALTPEQLELAKLPKGGLADRLNRMHDMQEMMNDHR